MNFIYPNILWALALLAIPIIIHLFYFRRFKKVYFSNVKFLQEIKEETSSRNKIKNLLVLLMRLLAIASLVFAFAQPFLSNSEDIKTGTKGISIYIDNSFSMSALSDDQSLLNLAKKKAIDIISAYDESDKIQVLTSDFEGRHQRFVTKEEARGLIDEISPSAEARNISSVINRQNQAFKTDAFDNNIKFIISDFQKSISDAVTIDTTEDISMIPLQSVKEANVAIDSVYLNSGVAILNQTNTLQVKITNYSSEAVENVRVTMNMNNQDKSVNNVSIPAESSQIIEVPFTPTHTGWHEASIKITDYPIVFDDLFYFSFYVNQEVNILTINQSRANPYLTAVFKDLNFFKFANVSVNQIKYDIFSDQDLIILNDLQSLSTGLQSELKQYIDNGGKVLIFPSSSADKASYNQLLATLRSNELREYSSEKKAVGSINKNEFIFDNVFETRQSENIKLPTSTGQYGFTQFQNRLTQDILKYRDGSIYLSKTTYGLGYLYMCSAPLNKNNNDLVLNAEIFVPMLYKMALSSGKSTRLAYTIGEDRLIKTNIQKSSEDENLRIVGPLEFIPGLYATGNSRVLNMSDQIKEAGFYKLELQDELLASYAYNYNKKESKLDYNNIDDLKILYGQNVDILTGAANADFTQIVSENEKGIILWRWFLIAALLFLLLEQLFIRLLK